jgi:flagellin-like hook-associated protein FlgL
MSVINTNISSLIAQQNLANLTSQLQTSLRAIEHGTEDQHRRR